MNNNPSQNQIENQTTFQSRKNLKARLTLKLVALLSILPSLLNAAPAPKDAGTGTLKVFSATQEVQWGEGSHYYPHTGYKVYDSKGQAVKWVDNNGTGVDSAPDSVELPAGTYTVWAQSEHDGYVKTIVVVRPSRLVELHLDGGDSIESAKAVASTKAKPTRMAANK